MARVFENLDFVEKLWRIIGKSDCYSPVQWGPRGRGIVLNSGGFWRLSLKINSQNRIQWPFSKCTLKWMKRQLKLHGFYVSKYSEGLFFHPAFRRGRPDLLHFIMHKKQLKVNFQPEIIGKPLTSMLITARRLLKSTLESTIKKFEQTKQLYKYKPDISYTHDSIMKMKLHDIEDSKIDGCMITSIEEFTTNLSNVQYNVCIENN